MHTIEAVGLLGNMTRPYGSPSVRCDRIEVSILDCGSSGRVEISDLLHRLIVFLLVPWVKPVVLLFAI